MVGDEEFHGHFSRFQFEPKTFLKGSEDARFGAITQDWAGVTRVGPEHRVARPLTFA